MKKILSICLAAAAFVGCTSTGVEFDTPNEIGFVAVADNITRNVVSGTVYPTDLNMYVYAWTSDQTSGTPNYINGGEFANRGAYNEINTTAGQPSDQVWGGGDGENANPYYWPNVKSLRFAGYSKSGSMASAAYAVTGDGVGTLTITDYTPGTGDNDLMYFPATAAFLGKETSFVPVTMYHTCSWITFLVKGDAVTAGKYTVTGLQINGIYNQADVECVAQTAATPIEWKNYDTPKVDQNVYTLNANTLTAVTLPAATTENGETKYPAVNVETGAAYALAAGGNVVVIPQTPGTLTLTYEYISPASQAIEEVKSGISLAVDAVNNKWEPGKHYIYTITIKANEILIAPEAAAWDEDTDNNITIE